MSKARNLSDFISDATIDSTEIADLSVTHAKLHTDMNLSSKTLTFAANQISGNSVDGGVISNFASTGIDDNASATAVTILSDGKVGIGTNSPAVALEIIGTTTSGIRIKNNALHSNGFNIYVDSSTDTAVLNNPFSGPMLFETANTERMQIDSSGNVGIGVSPSSGIQLKVGNSANNSAVSRVTNGTVSVDLTASSGGKAFLEVGTNHPLVIATNAAERMRIDSSGNVGIGETSPVGKLSIKGTTASNEKSHVTFENTQGSKVFAIGGGKSGITNNGFSIVNITDNNAPLHIDNSGNVGIGTTDPEDKLHIRGINEPAHIRLQRHESDEALDNGDEIGGIEFWANDGTYNSNASTLRAAIRAETQNTSSGTRLEFWTGNSTSAVEERMRIIADGKVGIGTTSPSATLHVEDTVTGGGNSGHMKLGHTRTRTFYAGISSSENRWYKVLNYGTGNMFTGKVQIYLTREGGFNQTGAHKEYRASLGGYSNSVYGPLSLSGDGGEGGVASLEIGTDAGVYLRVNSSIYGGSVFVIFSGQGGIGWAYNNSSYSTSLP
jgi:hypothetical protein